MVHSNGVVDLVLLGEAGGAYRIEASRDLSRWFLVSTGLAVNGQFTIRHDAATNHSTLFYRANALSESLPALSLVARTDTNLTVSTLASRAGGAAVLYGRDGTRFTLNLPSNSVPDATIMKMTLVTNITGLPFARGMLGAVRLEPANLAFWGAASLEIMFPSNINRREVSSFVAGLDGAAFQLTPDRVGTNRIVIAVARAGLYGSSLVTTQELAWAAEIETSSSAARASSQTAMSLKSAATECFPEKQLAATQASKEIDRARAANEQKVAALLGAERQRQKADESKDSSGVIDQVAGIMCAFYSAQIAPRWAEAANNCALGEVLVQNTLLIERGRQLLGAAVDDRCPGISSIPFCAIYKNCLEDIRECCARGMRGSEKVAAVRSLQRQDALLGDNCISQAEAQEVIDLCSTPIWTGTFSMSEIGSQSSVTSIPGSGSLILTDVDLFAATFEGNVELSEEVGDPDFGYLVELRVVGEVTQSAFHKKQQDSVHYIERCPRGGGGIQTGLILNQTEHSAAGVTAYNISFIIQPGGTNYSSFGALNYDPDEPNPPPPGVVSYISYQDEHSPCSGFTLVKNQSGASASPYFGNRTLNETSGPMANPNVVSGSFSMDEPGNPPRHIEFKWNFRRR